MATPGKPTNKKASAASPPASGDRLQKFLASCGISSRRAAEELIVQGRVEVNGQVITQLGTRVDPAVDEVRLDGEKLRGPGERLVLLLHKPVGYLCTVSDPEHRQLVYSLVPKDLALRSIGRLDFNTEGVLLFTNDGALAERIGHARFSVQRVYEARVRGVPSADTLAQLQRGVRLEDGLARAENAAIVKQTEQNAWVRLTLVEGRYREVRRMLERVGHPVVRLRRIAYAGLGVGELKAGQWRLLSPSEIEQLERKGHVGAFELPPDPRRKGNWVQTSKLPAKAPRSQSAAPSSAPKRPAKPARDVPADKPDRRRSSNRNSTNELPRDPQATRRPPRRADTGRPAAPRDNPGRSGGARPGAPRDNPGRSGSARPAPAPRTSGHGRPSTRKDSNELPRTPGATRRPTRPADGGRAAPSREGGTRGGPGRSGAPPRGNGGGRPRRTP